MTGRKVLHAVGFSLMGLIGIGLTALLVLALAQAMEKNDVGAAVMFGGMLFLLVSISAIAAGRAIYRRLTGARPLEASNQSSEPRDSSSTYYVGSLPDGD